jgi:hypothetical protein
MNSEAAKAAEASRVRRKRPSLVTAARIKRIGDILRLNLGARARDRSDDPARMRAIVS